MQRKRSGQARRHSSLNVSLVRRSGRIESDALHAERAAGSSPRELMLQTATVSVPKSERVFTEQRASLRPFSSREKRTSERTSDANGTRRDTVSDNPEAEKESPPTRVATRHRLK